MLLWEHFPCPLTPGLEIPRTASPTTDSFPHPQWFSHCFLGGGALVLLSARSQNMSDHPTFFSPFFSCPGLQPHSAGAGAQLQMSNMRNRCTLPTPRVMISYVPRSVGLGWPACAPVNVCWKLWVGRDVGPAGFHVHPVVNPHGS